MKITRIASFLLAVSLTSLGWTQENATPQKIDVETKDEVLKDLSEVLESVAFVPGVKFEKWGDLLKKYEPEINQAETAESFALAINRAFQEFGFSHILLFSPVASERRTTNKMVGLGVRIQIEEKGVRVVRVFEDGAAYEAGLKAGDLIIEADGKPIEDATKLAGKEGESVKLKIDRNNVIIERDLVRKRFAMVIPEEIFWPKPDVAHITIPSFDAEYNQDRVQQLMSKAKDAKGIILDVRGNGGGRVINLLHLASYFLTRNEPLGTFVDRTGLERYTTETGETDPDLIKVADWTKSKVVPMRRNREPYQGNVVVLVDGGTGSASEMIAAALQEQRGSKIVGSKTAGAVLASTMRPISGGFLLQFPLMDYVTIKGHRLEGTGIVPDVSAPTPRFGEVDRGVEEALTLLGIAAKKAA